jgi:hypothetical protein
VLRYRFDVKRLGALSNIAHQTLAESQADLSHNGLIQALGCSKYIAVLLIIEQVNATDFGCHDAAHTINGHLERRS